MTPAKLTSGVRCAVQLKNQEISKFTNKILKGRVEIDEIQEAIRNKQRFIKEHYLKEVDHILYTFMLLEKSLNEEKNILLTMIDKSMQSSLATLDQFASRLGENAQEILKFQEDIQSNIDNIILEMHPEPFQEILTTYNARIDEFAHFTQGLRQRSVQIVTMKDFSNHIDFIKQQIFPNVVQVESVESALVPEQPPNAKPGREALAGSAGLSLRDPLNMSISEYLQLYQKGGQPKHARTGSHGSQPSARKQAYAPPALSLSGVQNPQLSEDSEALAHDLNLHLSLGDQQFLTQHHQHAPSSDQYRPLSVSTQKTLPQNQKRVLRTSLDLSTDQTSYRQQPLPPNQDLLSNQSVLSQHAP